MVRVKSRDGPLDYRLCNQTVTLYHWAGGDDITRRIIYLPSLNSLNRHSVFTML